MEENMFITYTRPQLINPITVYQAEKILTFSDIRDARKIVNYLKAYFKENYSKMRDKLQISISTDETKRSSRNNISEISLDIIIMSTNQNRINSFINTLIEDLLGDQQHYRLAYFSGILFTPQEKDIYFNLPDYIGKN